MEQSLGIARRLGWGVGDQALSSLANFALSVAAARLVSAHEFGAFAVAFATYLVALNVTRHLSAQPLAVRYPEVNVETWQTAAAASTGLIVVLSVAMGGLFVMAGIVLGEALGAALIALGVTLPGLLLQDGWRFAFFARARGDMAFRNDLTWVAVLFGGLAILVAITKPGVFLIVLLWGIAGTAASLVGIVQAKVVPDIRRAREWWREHRDIGPRYLASELSTMGATQFTIYVVGIVAGLAAAGSLRAAQVLLGPVNIMSMAVHLVVIPTASRLFDRSAERFTQLCVATSTLLVTAIVAEVAVVLAFPDLIGPTLLGASWPGASIVFVPVALAMLAQSASKGPRLGLAATAAARTILKLTVAEAILSMLGGLIGVLVGGAYGAASGMALGYLVMVGPWWLQLRQRSAHAGRAARLRGAAAVRSAQ